MTLKLVANDVSVQIAAAFSGKSARPTDSVYGTIQTAATETIAEVAGLLKSGGRQNIASAGFSVKWQNAWRVNVYPQKGVSINAAAWGFHKIPYSLVFEEGADIRAKRGLLWLPLGSVPRLSGRRSGPASPKSLSQSGVKLFTINRPGKKPLLATNVRLTGAQPIGNQSLSLAKLKKGTAGKRGVIKAVPLFVGVDTVHVRKAFDIEGVADRIVNQLGDLYYKHVQDVGA